MLKITELFMWKDPGYTMGCTEVPPAGSTKLPKADWSLPDNTPMRPLKAVTLSSFEIGDELGATYLSMRDMKYAFVKMTDAEPGSGGETFTFFAWITSIERLASAHENIRFNYEIDYWRTFADQCTFGAGHVQRCGDGSYKRPTQVRPRKWIVNKKAEIFPRPAGTSKWYDYVVIVVYATVDSDGEPTKIDYLYWRTSYDVGESINTGNSPSLQDVYASSFYQDLDISPTNVIAIYVSPITPWESNTSYVHVHTTTVVYRRPETIYVPGPFDDEGSYIPGSPLAQTLPSEFTSDDTHKTVIINPMGTVVATLPWGRSTDHITGICDVGTTAANLQINLLAPNETSNNDNVVHAAAEGYRVTVPLISVPINKSGWDAYVLSGQRSYDKRMAEIQRNQSLVSGITGIGTGAAGGAIGSSMAGKGLGVGALVGAGASAAGAGINYFTAGYFNDQLQQEQDKLVSNQAANVVVDSGGDNWTINHNNPAHWYIVEMVMDDVSQDEYDNNAAVNGYPVDMPFTDVSGFITAGGPLQMTNVMITSQTADLAGIAAIKAQLERGVRIQENNPNGYDYGSW